MPHLDGSLKGVPWSEEISEGIVSQGERMILTTLRELLLLDYRRVATKGDPSLKSRYDSLKSSYIYIGPLVVSRRGYDRYVAQEGGVCRMTFSSPDESFESLESVDIATRIAGRSRIGGIEAKKLFRLYRGNYWHWQLNDVRRVLDGTGDQEETEVVGDGQ